MKMEDPKSPQIEPWDLEQSRPRKTSGIFNVFIAGLALFSDGYNGQISMCRPSWDFVMLMLTPSVGYMQPLFSVL